MVDLDATIQREKEREVESTQRLSYLTSRKKEMGAVERIEREFARLTQETERLGLKVAADKELLDVTSSVQEQIESMNSSLRAVAEKYTKVFTKLDRTIKRLEAISER